MPEKNVRFQEWLEKFRRIMDESIAELRAIKVKARRVREEKDKIKWYHFPTQVILRDVIRSLILIYEEASPSLWMGLEAEGAGKAGRLAAYIAQTINTILNSHDILIRWVYIRVGLLSPAPFIF